MDLRGQRQQISESLGALYVWFPVALLGIYTVLAGIFRSYVQPVIIMVTIPFGVVGAIIGHWIMGYDVTLLSLFLMGNDLRRALRWLRTGRLPGPDEAPGRSSAADEQEGQSP